MPLAATAAAQLMLGEHEKAVTAARRGLQVYPTHTPCHLIAIAGLMRLGLRNEARAQAKRLLEISPGIRVSKRLLLQQDQFVTELLEAGLPE
jgi:hypothetical protein